MLQKPCCPTVAPSVSDSLMFPTILDKQGSTTDFITAANWLCTKIHEYP